MKKVEKQISELKIEKFTDLCRPVSAFIIFEEEDAKALAVTSYEP